MEGRKSSSIKAKLAHSLSESDNSYLEGKEREGGEVIRDLISVEAIKDRQMPPSCNQATAEARRVFGLNDNNDTYI